MTHTAHAPYSRPSRIFGLVAWVGRVLAALASALAMVLPATAQTAPFAECPPYLLVHGNGINTSLGDAIVNLRQLSEAVGTDAGRTGYEVRLQLAWARPGVGGDADAGIGSMMADLLESYRLKVVLGAGGDRAWAVFLRAVGFATGLVSDNPPPWWTYVIADSVNQMTRDYQAALTQWLAARLLDTSTKADLASHVALYKAALKQGQRVVVVAHSQGNLFANAAYQALVADPEIGRNPRLLIVGAATPAKAVASDPTSTKYVTSNFDQVINLVRLTDPMTLAANVSLVPIDLLVSPFDALGHSFVNVYLSPALPLRALIISLVGDRIERLPQNCFEQIIETAGTYLQHPPVDPGSGDFDNPPTSIDLSLLAAGPGTVLDLRTRGTFYFRRQNSAGGGSWASAVFRGGGRNLAPGLVDSANYAERYPLVTTPTCTTPSYATDIPEDFRVDWEPNNLVRVPTGASAMLIASNDCYWGDNGQEDRFRVRVIVLPPNN